MVGRAGCLARYLGLPYRIIVVEPEPTHFQWLTETLAENRIAAETIQGAVAATAGVSRLCIDGPPPEAWYGQWLLGEPYGRRFVDVPTCILESILRPFESVDLIDLDIRRIWGFGHRGET